MTMLYNNIPLLMVIVFLLLTLGVGFYVRPTQTTDLRSYTIGHKQFTTATLVATTLATTWGGAQVVRDVENIHHFGLYWIVFTLLNFSDILAIIPLSSRMAPFMQHLSIAETIGSVYGKYPRIITAISGISAAIAITASQINVMTLTIRLCIGSVTPQTITYLTILATVILITYTTFGGIHAVTFTDVLQFITFTIIIPLLTICLCYKLHKPVDEMMVLLKNQKHFQCKSLFIVPTTPLVLLGTVLGIVAAIDPTTMQRVYMASGTKQAQRVFLYAGLCSFIISVFVILIGIFVCIDAPTLPKEAIWYYIITQCAPPLQGLLCISLLAMTMSTADSKLHTCATMIGHELVDSFKIKLHPIRIVKIASILVGIFAMLLALACKDLFALLKLALDLYVPIVTAPLVLAIYGLRHQTHTVLMGMAAGTLAIIAWKQWVEAATAIPGAFPAMLANGLTMMVIHHLSPRKT